MFDAAQVDQAAQMYRARDLGQRSAELAYGEAEKEARDKEIIRQSAQAAVDPATGQYSLERHVQLLEQSGFPDVAETYKRKSIENLRFTYDAIDKALPTVNEQNYPALRQALTAGGMPPQLIPEKFDPKWLEQQHERLGVTLERWGPMEKVADGPAGTVLYGQRNQRTGQLVNVRDMSPPRPYAPGTRGGGYAPSNMEKMAEFYAETYGIPLNVALDIVRNETRGGRDPYKAYERIYATMLTQYATAEEADMAARDMVESLYGPGSIDLRSRPSRPLSGEPQPGAGTPNPGRLTPEQTRNPTVPVQLPNGRTAQIPNRAYDPATAAGPDPSQMQPGRIYTLRNGERWKLGPDGAPVRVSPP